MEAEPVKSEEEKTRGKKRPHAEVSWDEKPDQPEDLEKFDILFLSFWILLVAIFIGVIYVYAFQAIGKQPSPWFGFSFDKVENLQNRLNS